MQIDYSIFNNAFSNILRAILYSSLLLLLKLSIQIVCYIFGISSLCLFLIALLNIITLSTLYNKKSNTKKRFVF